MNGPWLIANDSEAASKEKFSVARGNAVDAMLALARVDGRGRTCGRLRRALVDVQPNETTTSDEDIQIVGWTPLKLQAKMG